MSDTSCCTVDHGPDGHEDDPSRDVKIAGIRAAHVDPDETTAAPARAPYAAAVAAAAVIALVRFGPLSGAAIDNLSIWSTLFTAVVLQAAPFLVLGVVISGLLAAVVPPGLVAKVLPRRSAFAVPAAGLAGAALPGCECGSVPVARRLIDEGVPAAPALTFLLAAPAINPIVIISTFVAFPGTPQMAIARFCASLAAAVVAGLWWARLQSRDSAPPVSENHHRHARGFAGFADAAAKDLVHAAGYLVVGAAAAATIGLAAPTSLIDFLSNNELAAIAGLALFAIIVSICSEADAFVAAGLPQFSLTSRLVFLVVGPVCDLKLIGLHLGTFGARHTRAFVPVTVVAAVAAAVIAGKVFL